MKFIVRVWVDLEIDAETAEEAVVLAKSTKTCVESHNPAIETYDTQIADVRRKESL